MSNMRKLNVFPITCPPSPLKVTPLLTLLIITSVFLRSFPLVHSLWVFHLEKRKIKLLFFFLLGLSLKTFSTGDLRVFLKKKKKKESFYLDANAS